MQAWRIAKAEHIADLSGGGAALLGGRWNLPDQPALYLELSPAGSALNAAILAGHLPRLPLKLMRLQLPTDPALYLEPPLSALPEGWDTLPPDRQGMAFGSEWLRRREQLGLILPSAALDQTRCLLINPEHPACQQIQVLDVSDFAYGALSRI